MYGSTGRLGYTDAPAFTGDAILMARVGVNAGHVYLVSGDYDVSDNTLVLRPIPEWNPRFAFHQLSFMNMNQFAIGAGQPLVTAGRIKGRVVALPSMDVQREVASKLDHLEVLSRQLMEEIGIEASARRQQYEYYRERLLTFREAA